MRGLLGGQPLVPGGMGPPDVAGRGGKWPVQAISSLMQNVSFYANTTIYVIAESACSARHHGQALIDVASDLPFARHVSEAVGGQADPAATVNASWWPTSSSPGPCGSSTCCVHLVGGAAPSIRGGAPGGCPAPPRLNSHNTVTEFNPRDPGVLLRAGGGGSGLCSHWAFAASHPDRAGALPPGLHHHQTYAAMRR